MTEEPAVPTGPGRRVRTRTGRGLRRRLDRRASPDRSRVLADRRARRAARLVVGFGALGPLRAGGALGAPRFVDETASAGLAHTYGGDDTFDVGGGRRGLRLRRRRPARRLPGRGRQPAPRSSATRARPAARCGSRRSASPVTDLTGVTGAYPDRHRQRRDRRPRGPADRGAELLRGLGDCRFEPANDTWGVSPTTAEHDGVQCHVGGRRRRCRRWRSATTSRRSPTGRTSARTTRSSGRTPPARGTAPRSALAPGYCPLSMLFSDWDGSGRRDLRISNDRQYYDNDVGGEQLWRFEPGRAPRAYTAADGWALLRLWGMGIASYDVTGDGYPGGLPHEPGREHAPDPGRRAVAARVPRTSPSSTGSTPPGRSSAATRCPRPPGTRSSRT